MNNNNMFVTLMVTPNKLPQVARINLNDPEVLNNIIGSYIDVSATGLPGVVTLCKKGNLEAGSAYDSHDSPRLDVNTIIIAGMKDNEFISLSAEQILKALSHIDEWRRQQSLMVN